MKRPTAVAIVGLAFLIGAISAPALGEQMGLRFYLQDQLTCAYRDVAVEGNPVEAAVRALVAGPDPAESAMGFTSAIPPGVTVENVAVKDDVVEISLSAGVLNGFDESALYNIFKQFSVTLGDFPKITKIMLLHQGRLLSSYLSPSPAVGVAAKPLEPTRGISGLGGRNITIGPSHGRFWNGSGWYWQRSDPCGYGEAVLEDTNSIRLMQFLYQYLAQDGATVHVPRELNESNCCNGYEGQPWWKMAAYSWLRINGLPTSVWASYSGVGGEETATGRSSDDIRARPLFADYRGSEIYIAHHTNAGGGTGMETFRDTAMDYPAHEAASYNLALAVHNNTLNAIYDMYDGSFANRGVKDAAGGFGEIRIPNRPACLVELAFHDKCDKDAIYLMDDFFRSVAMWGMYNGICSYFGTSPTWGKYSDEYVSDTIPSTMNAGQSYSVSITFRNRGVLWREGRAFRLGAAGDSDPFTGTTRHTISGDVRPGNTYTFTFTMTAPVTPGVYTTDWQMVRDGVAWFGATHSEQVTVNPTHDYRRNWMLIGPYSSTSIETNSLGVDETGLWAWSGTPLNGKSWTSYSSPTIYVDLDAALGGADSVTSYAWAYVYTASSKSVYIRSGSDDQIKIWLNGANVYTYSSPRGHTYDQDNVGPVTLNAGWNRLLVKVHDDGGAFGFSFRFADDAAGNTDTTGLTWQVDDGWTPTMYVGSVNGQSVNPSPNANFFGNSGIMAFSGTAGASSGPVPFSVQYYRWGNNGTTTWAGVGSSGSTWSQSGTGFAGHNRWHFRTLTSSGRASAQWNNTGGSNYFDFYVDDQSPNAPPAPVATPVSASRIDLSWTLPSDRGSGTGALEGSDERLPDESNNDPSYNWYRVGDVGVGARRDGSSVGGWSTGTSYSDTGLLANTYYSYDVAARDNSGETRGTWHNTTAYTTPVSACTLIEQAQGIAAESVTADSISVKASGTFTNLTSGSSGIRLSNVTNSTDSGWVQNTAAWENTGLVANTEYEFSAVSRNAEGIENSPATGSVYTLAPAPTPGDISCNRAVSTWYGSGSFVFTAVAGFGIGRAEYYGYAWDASPTHSWTGIESQWASGTLDIVPETGGSWYLHVRSYNAEGAASGEMTLGPYLYDNVPPSEPSKLTASGYGQGITLQWINGADAHSGFGHVRIYRSDVPSESYSLVDGDETGTQWSESLGANNIVKYYRVFSVDNAGNESASYLQVAARTPINGVNIWTYSSDRPSLSPPSVLRTPPMVFAGSNDHQIHGIVSDNGLRIWPPYTTAGSVQGRCPVTLISGAPTLFAGSQDCYVYSLDALTGSLRWMSDLGVGNKVQAKLAGQLRVSLTAGPKAGQVRDAVMACTFNSSTSTGNFVRAYDGEDGSVLWTYAPGDMDVIPGSPAVVPSMNIAVVSSYSAGGTGQPSLRAIDTRSGTPLWTKNLGNISGSPATSDSGATTYVGTNGGMLYALQTATGAQKWEINLGSAVYGTPWYDSGYLYVATTNRVYCIGDGGTSAVLNTAWGNGSGFITIASPSQPVVSGSLSKLYVGSSDGNVYEVSMSNGARRPYNIGYTVGDPSIDIGKFYMYVGAGDGRIYALTVPFVRVDGAWIYGVLRAGGLQPDGPFRVSEIYSVRVKIAWRGVPPGTHTQKLRFYTPEGTFYQSVNTGFSAGSSGEVTEVWGELPVAGTWAERLLGKWRVDVTLDSDPTVFKTGYFVLQN